MEVRGFEPLASSMRPKRSSQLSYTPGGGGHPTEGGRGKLAEFWLKDRRESAEAPVMPSFRSAGSRRPVSRLLGPLLLAAALLIAACTPEQQQLMDLVNQSRAEAGVPALTMHLSAMDKAQAWADHMASEGRISHSNLRDGITGEWRQLGENVAMAPSIEAAHQALMDSPGHRANILNPEFNFGGTGHAIGDDGLVYVVQVFARY